VLANFQEGEAGGGEGGMLGWAKEPEAEKENLDMIST
jgi:hypothetical protein